MPATPTDDLNPRPLSVGRFTIQPLTVNTLILLEKIGSPFMADDFDAAANRYKDGRKVTMEELVRSFYVLAHADDPRLDEQVNDPLAFQRCVSAMAREITMAELAKLSASVGQQMGRVNQAIAETGAEGGGPKKETGPAS